MALFICPNCGNMISDKAPVCPKCGLANPHSHISDSPSTPNTPPPPPQPYNTPSADVPAEHSPLPYPEDNGYTPYGNDNFNSPNNNDNNNRSNRALWIVIIILLIAAAGIGTYFYIDSKNQQKREETERREQHRRDSIAAEEARLEALARLAALEKQRLDSIEWYSFTSPDLTLLDLHGHVKSVSYNEQAHELSYLYTFATSFKLNEQGQLQLSKLSASRNADGQITKVTDPAEFDGHYMSISWSGNKPETFDGFWVEGGEYGSFEYSDGELKYIQSTGGGEGCSFSENTSITHLETDDHGNWTKIKLSINGTNECEDAYDYQYFHQEPYSNTIIITRRIEYYPFLP